MVNRGFEKSDVVFGDLGGTEILDRLALSNIKKRRRLCHAWLCVAMESARFLVRLHVLFAFILKSVN